MYRYVVIVILLIIFECVKTAPPVRLTINCGSGENLPSTGGLHSKSSGSFDLDSFCGLIHRAIPKAVKDGRFVLVNHEDDQYGHENALVPISVAPPSGFVPKFPKFKTPRLKVPKLNVPKLGIADRTFSAPKVGSPMSFSTFREVEPEESSAEKMDKFKKGVQKLLHVVKVLGQIDQYLSERTRLIIEKLSHTFAD